MNLGLAVDVEKRDGSRTLMVPVILDAGRLPFDRFLAAYDALVEKARTNTLTADDLVGANVTLTNPGGLGTVASVPRLMAGQGTIVATGSIAYPVGLGDVGAMIGAEKVMTMTSTYDHRVIQGAESGRFLALIEEYLQGERRLLRGRVRLAGLELGPAAAARAGRRGRRRRIIDATRAPAPRRRNCCRRCRRPARSSPASAAMGTWRRALTRSAQSPRAIPGSTPSRSG